MRGRWFVRGAALVALLSGAAGRAQEQVIVHAENERQICSIKVTLFGGSGRIGGFGFVLVDAQNHDERSHVLQVRLHSQLWASNDVRLQRSLVLGPQERGRFFLPLPNTAQSNYELRVVVDTTKYDGVFLLTPNRGLTGLLVSDRPQTTPAALALLQAAAARAPFEARDKHQVVPCSTIDVPADWRSFTGFDLVLVDGRSRVDAQVQQALRRYAFAGGRVFVAAPRSLPAGDLRERLEQYDEARVVAHGLGFLVAVPSLEPGVSDVRDMFDAMPSPREGLWPLPEPLCATQVVPGLDQAPVLVFLFVILLFAVLAGPVNFFLLRRWRRPMLALVTVPALGLGTTLLMFVYAFAHDGFGVRGVVRTWTLLDQRDHQAVTIGARTLFTGLAPDSLQLDADTLIVAPAAFSRPGNSRSPDRWQFDADTNLLDGGVLPSRTTSVLVEARQGVARERLRARVRPDGALELLTDGGVVPVGVVLLRDPDGQHWVGEGRVGEGTVLQRCTDEVAERTLGTLARAASRFRIVQPRDQGPQSLPRRSSRQAPAQGDGTADVDLEMLTTRLVADATLAAGSYITQVAAAPWANEHGLRVDYDLEQHYVVGQLAAEDFLR